MHNHKKQKNKRLRALFIRAILAFPFLLVFVLVLLVRFTDGTISSNEKIVLGYDERNARFQIFEDRVYHLDGNDGPYVFYDSKVYTVNVANEVVVTDYADLDNLVVQVNDAERTTFTVTLVATAGEDTAIFQMPQQLIAISDMEGNFEAFSDFLITHNVIDDALRWTYGANSLVLVGDFVDRGDNVTQMLWLIYKLEQEAVEAGGRVHFLLGNHEVLNMQGNLYYAEDKYVRIAEEIAAREQITPSKTSLFHASSVLGTWLRQKNAVAKIGTYVFMHAGLSPAVTSQQLPLALINDVIRQNLDNKLYSSPGQDSLANLLAGRTGPLWYRGLVTDYKAYYAKASSEHVDTALSFYRAEHLVIGHTVVDAVSTDFEGRVIRIDVKHSKEKGSHLTQGLLIDNGVPYRITGKGTKEKL